MTETFKRQQDTPDSEQPQAKRRKVERRSLDAGASLALEHLLHDETTHPLYQKNAEHIISSVVDREALTDLIARPFDRCLNQDLFSSSNLDEKKIELAKQTLVTSLSKVVLAALGKQIAGVYNVNSMRGKLDVVEEARGYRVELGIRPVEDLVDDNADPGPNANRVTTGEDTAAGPGRKSGKKSRKRPQLAAANGTGASTSRRRPSDPARPQSGRKRRAARACAIQRSTEQAFARGRYSDAVEPEGASGSSDSDSNKSDNSDAAEDEEEDDDEENEYVE